MKFQPPLASHMGGVWERMVGSVKKILKVMMKQSVFGDEVLQTVLKEVEGVLNSTPISQLHQDSRHAEPLNYTQPSTVDEAKWLFSTRCISEVR